MDSFPFKVAASPAIRDGDLNVLVAPIKFDSKPRLVAVEIKDKGWNGMLAPKLEAAERSVAEKIPEAVFCIGLVLA